MGFHITQASIWHDEKQAKLYNKGETAVHDSLCPGDMAVRMREVLARPWVGLGVSRTLKFV